MKELDEYRENIPLVAFYLQQVLTSYLIVQKISQTKLDKIQHRKKNMTMWFKATEEDMTKLDASQNLFRNVT